MRRGARWLLIVPLLGTPMSNFAAGSAQPLWDCVAGRTSISKAATRLKASEAIALASTAARNQGIELSKFRQSSVCFDGSMEPGLWTVFFEGREPRLGNHFLVWVKDDTGTTKVMFGE